MLDVLLQSISLFSTAAFQFMPLQDMAGWPVMWILLPCMLGGMSLSTAGGIKIQRLIIVARDIANELARLTHPASVQSLRYDSLQVSGGIRNALWSYFATFLLFIALGIGIGGMLGVNLDDAWPLTLATISNSGAMLSLTQTNLAELSPLMYICTAFLMIAGRVELLVFLALFNPSFWRFAR